MSNLEYPDIPLQMGQTPTDSQKRLNELFDEMDKKQLDFLDQAGKRIIELSTGLLGILFAVTAFGDKFPPPYLASHPIIQILAVGVLVVLMVALLCAVITIQPRRYKFYEHNLSEMRAEWIKLVNTKAIWFTTANWFFFVGALLLAILVGVLILSI